MHLRPLGVALLLVSACSRSNPDADASGDGSSSGTYDASSFPEDDSGSSGSSSGDSSSGSEGDGSSTGGSTSSSDGSGDSSDTTGWTASGGSTDESSTTGSTTAPAPFCGDGEVDDGEDCDDGNAQPGDGCDACAWEPWEHEGVAHDVPVADLHGWSLCWTDDYSGTADLPVSSLAEACSKTHLLVGCKMKESDNLALAAHAPRGDVMFPVDYSSGERHEVNGVAWYWAPTYDEGDIVGFAPAGSTTKCNVPGEDEQLCWKTNLDEFSFGTRCGSKLGFSDLEAPMWQRFVFERN